MKRVVPETLFLIIVPISMSVFSYFDVGQSLIFSTLIAVLSIVYFFFAFEKSQGIKVLLPIVVMSSVAIVSRMFFAPLPSIKPIFAIFIITGVCFGRQSGFMVGATTALISNMFFGQGPWTPWQMYGFGLIGYFSGLVGQTDVGKKLPVVFVLGAVFSVVFSLIMDSWFILGFVRPLTWASVMTAYGAGIPVMITYIVSTEIFLSIFFLPWKKKLTRIRLKYEL